MIGHLDGRIIELQPGLVMLEVGGVGYEIHLPVSAHPYLAGRERAALFVHTHVREDQLALYGSRPGGSATRFGSCSRFRGSGRAPRWRCSPA
jgi:Holliday junction DNA helicase RuvA